MTQDEFNKAPLLDQVLYDQTGLIASNHPSFAKAMEEYAKLKIEESKEEIRQFLIDEDFEGLAERI